MGSDPWLLFGMRSTARTPLPEDLSTFGAGRKTAAASECRGARDYRRCTVRRRGEQRGIVTEDHIQTTRDRLGPDRCGHFTAERCCPRALGCTEGLRPVHNEVGGQAHDQ
jgi:hypothetical protein